MALSNPPLFTLGQVVATRNAHDTLSALDIRTALGRHMVGDWGDLDNADKKENEFSIENGLRLLSSYTSQDGTKFWIITEADRSVTTVLLPEDY